MAGPSTFLPQVVQNASSGARGLPHPTHIPAADAWGAGAMAGAVVGGLTGCGGGGAGGAVDAGDCAGGGGGAAGWAPTFAPQFKQKDRPGGIGFPHLGQTPLGAGGGACA